MCLRALAKKPGDRYTSAGELAREVQRWLADEPVTAFREPIVERLGRWARRRKPLVAGLAAAFLATVVGTAVILEERQRSEEQVQAAEKINAIERKTTAEVKTAVHVDHFSRVVRNCSGRECRHGFANVFRRPPAANRR